MAAKRSREPPRKRLRSDSRRDSDIEDNPGFAKDEAAQFGKALLRWYDKEHRLLPWRRNQRSLHQSPSDPQSKLLLGLDRDSFMYRVWVSEVMLQQTQVSRAISFYKRWIEKWPTVQALAKADMQQVNEVWAGLGYYRRAKFLLEGAQYVSAHLGGKLPITSEELQKIPGIGVYTGNAMASIAAGERVAAVDANVVRVLSRLRCLEHDPKSKASVALHAMLAASLLDPERPGDFNQAMMELGACICTGSQPQCEACPVRQQCCAYKQLQEFIAAGGKITAEDAPLVTKYPTKGERLLKKEHCRAVCVVRLQVPPSKARPQAETLYLLVKRGEKGLLAGLWEFPGQEVGVELDAVERRRSVDKYLNSMGCIYADGSQLQVLERRQVGETVHEFSHIRCTMRVDLLVLEGQVPIFANEQAVHRPAMRWVEHSALVVEGLSSRERKVWKLLGF